MAKAFDTVRHDYMTSVYKFFGIGDNFIKMLNTISSGRTACIIKEDGETTPAFRLGSGFPQGNPPSPNQFNMGEQILILKIELDPRIKKIRNSPVEPILLAPLNNHNIAPIPVPVPAPDAAPAPIYENNVGRQYGSKENFRNTEKVEAFADDNNILSKLDRECLSANKRNT
jgi:hypothetical protein